MVTLQQVASQEPAAALEILKADLGGLTTSEAASRLKTYGPNAVQEHGYTVLQLLLRQLKSPILVLLAGAAALSGLLGDSANALVIGVILMISVLLGFSTEFRSERANADLRAKTSHLVTTRRDGQDSRIAVQDLVPGDIVRIGLGSVVPADLRLLECEDLECDESILTGESMPVTKTSALREPGSNCVLMGTVVHRGSAIGVVVQTGGNTEFGAIAGGLSARVPETDFQRGLREFSTFLLRIALSVATVVVASALLLNRSAIDSVLFALALAVGMTPQLLPAIVSTALALGSRELAKHGVLVKRLVSIEDMGDMDVLVTDKTGTLTVGAIAFEAETAFTAEDLLALGLMATDVDWHKDISRADLNPLDAALWRAPESSHRIPPAYSRLDSLPFDHDRRITSTLVDTDGEVRLVAKGSPEDILKRCRTVTDEQTAALKALYAQGKRVLAVATRSMPGTDELKSQDEFDLELQGLLSFSDPVKADATESLKRLMHLGIEVKIASGDSPAVSQVVCQQVGLKVTGTLTGTEVDALDDQQLALAVAETNLFARVSPAQKARIVRAIRADGKAVGFLGDGVNDAIALHDADVGISVDSATDVARDAADIVLLDKDLAVLANGVHIGRRVFSNTMKYVLMGTAGDFGNMISAAIGSVLLPFLPMLPGQVLLQDLMYDASQLAIPSDRVDPEQTARPSHWRVDAIRRFMLIFGLISSIFDLATFAFLYFVLDAGEAEFQTGWFLESLATATLIVLAVRTRRVPFYRSKPSVQLTLSVMGVVGIGVLITATPLGSPFGFAILPWTVYAAIALMVIGYLVLVEFAKRRLSPVHAARPSQYRRGHSHRVHRRAARFSHPQSRP